MIIIDTNIISEMMKTSPSLQVIDWLDQQEATKLFITTVTIAEIFYGLNVLSQGKRRASLENAFSHTIEEAFMHRMLSFDEPSARLYGQIMGRRKALGQPLSMADGQIAAIARAHEAIIATRNVRDFIHCEIELINPFDGSVHPV